MLCVVLPAIFPCAPSLGCKGFTNPLPQKFLWCYVGVKVKNYPIPTITSYLTYVLIPLTKRQIHSLAIQARPKRALIHFISRAN
ncbi:hypothetical protein AOQ84DRAFT_101273 [Glonium stellatum]|uniref:Uncharacterized protein n=1 Tax=Glonium stellatum TaxID=574774 RepID=A0A8E2JQC8_9PEZI|nr:hypothetical protein AOQ84DRAFT_101273 [Glonium stellatum]